MMKYLITIITLSTGSKSFLERDEETITPTIQKELGGWDNLYGASTSGANVHANSYCQAGTTRDGAKMYSILCYQ